MPGSQRNLDPCRRPADIAVMNKIPHIRILSILGAVAALAGCAGTTSTLPTANNTYTITRQAGSGLDRDTDALEDQVKDSAAQFCASRGKQLKIVSLTANKPLFLTGYATATIVFKALDAGDPELTASGPAPVASVEAPPAAPAAPAVAPMSGDLYTQLTKLDELRKKGILTDEEFQSEKKKVLSHSN